MKITTTLLSCPISYDISQYGVHVICDDNFYQLIRVLPRTGVEVLALALLRDFDKVQMRPLQISKESLMIEIWGHYYFEKVFHPFKWMLRHPLLTKFKRRLVQATDVIDCAETGYDSNRWIWDALVPLFKLIRAGMHDAK